MTRRSRRELERDLEDLRDRDSDTRLFVVGDAPSTEYLSAEEYERRRGQPPAESDDVVIRVPRAAEERY